jgi:hypothetical protein
VKDEHRCSNPDYSTAFLSLLAAAAVAALILEWRGLL